MRMSTLAEAMSFSRSRITHTITRMEGSGLVNRGAATEDGRGIVAQLTDKGYALLVEAAPVHVTGVREHMVDLASDDDFAALGRVMDAVVDQLAARPEVDLRTDGDLRTTTRHPRSPGDRGAPRCVVPCGEVSRG